MKRAIFDLIKKAKLNSLVGGAIGKKNAMMNDNLNVCLPSVWFFISLELHDGLCFIVPLMLFTINHKSWRQTFNELDSFTC
jgi:hypothetical protein